MPTLTHKEFIEILKNNRITLETWNPSKKYEANFDSGILHTVLENVSKF